MERIDKYTLKPMANIRFAWNRYYYYHLNQNTARYFQFFKTLKHTKSIFEILETNQNANLELFGEGFLSLGALCSQSLLAVSFPSSRITARNSTGQSSSSKDLTLEIQIYLFQKLIFFLLKLFLFQNSHIKTFLN